MALRPVDSGWFQSVLSVSAPLTIFASRTRAGSLSNRCFLRIASKEHSLPWWPNSTPGTSYGIAPSRRATTITWSAGTKRNSATGSMNFRINQGQATRSTFTRSRVTHFMGHLFLRQCGIERVVHHHAALDRLLIARTGQADTRADQI